ncbi:MAG TPA: DUF742 domain-containing protein [Pseudonocardiaceae bacterium]|jgi:hypothetical protein|nr:DUF742 domain-containing protein [Pseudonocardiaceae bacterium]
MNGRPPDEPLRRPDPRMIPVTRPKSWFEPVIPPGEARDRGEDAERRDVFVRPFIMTEGRTRPLHDGLRVETLVHARPAALSAPLRFEHHTIVRLCQRPVAVAEVAAVLRVPLGVAQVLVADLYADNLVQLHEPTELPLHVIERIRDLVRAL